MRKLVIDIFDVWMRELTPEDDRFNTAFSLSIDGTKMTCSVVYEHPTVEGYKFVYDEFFEMRFLAEMPWTAVESHVYQTTQLVLKRFAESLQGEFIGR